MRIPKLRRNGDGRAFVEIPKSKGKRIYLGTFGSQDANNKYAEWVKRYLAGYHEQDTVSTSDLMVIEVVAKYLDFAKGYYSYEGEPTREFYGMKAALGPFSELFASLPAEQIGARELKTYVSHLATKTITKEDGEVTLSRGYINKHLSRVKRFIRWGEQEGHLPEGSWNRARLVEGLKRGRTSVRETDKVQPVPVADVLQTIPFMNPVIADMVKVQLLCGMRPQDVINMKWELIDQSEDVWFYSPDRHKNDYRGQGLIKAIPENAQNVLRAYDYREPDQNIFSPKEALRRQIRSVHGPTDVTVRSGIRNSYTNNTYGQAISRAIAKAETHGKSIEPWSPNQLRHSIGSYIRSKANADTARAYLGHSDLDSTEIYAELDRVAMKKAAKVANTILDDLGR